MSTTTVSVTRTAEEIRLEEVRVKEAAAREAALRRLGIANTSIDRSQARFKQLLSRLDEAASRLPDLKLQAPSMESFSSEYANDPTEVEAFASNLMQVVDRFQAQLEMSIHEAEVTLKRRLATAQAWRTSLGLEQQVEFNFEQIQRHKTLLESNEYPAERTTRPSKNAELEQVQAYINTLKSYITQSSQLILTIERRAATRELGKQVTGKIVTATQSAGQVLDTHQALKNEQAKQRLQAVIENALKNHKRDFTDLEQHTQTMLNALLDQAHLGDVSDMAERSIARDLALKAQAIKAENMLRQVPELIYSNPVLAKRWEVLSSQLQQVANGLEVLSPSIDKELRQIRIDSQLAVNDAFSKADFIAALSEHFEVFESDTGLVAIDLENPEVWLEASEVESESGGFAAILQMKTDSKATLNNEKQITNDVCKKINRIATHQDEKVNGVSEVVEHESTITRSRRPTRPTVRKTFAINQ